MIEEFRAFFVAFQEGKELANAKIWKDRQHLGNALLGFLGAVVVILGGFGYKLELDTDTLQNLSGGIVALVGIVNQILTITTSSKVGIKNPG